MEQKTYRIYRLSDAVKLRDELVEQAQLQKAHAALLQVYVSRFRSDEIEDILAPFREAFPNLGIVGMTIWGNERTNSEKFVCLSFLTFEEAEVEILEYDFDTASQSEIIRDAREHLRQTSFAAGVQVIGSHYLANYTSILAQLSEGYKNIPFFGSLAINNTEDQTDTSEDDPLFAEGEEDHTPAIEKSYVYAIGSRTLLRGMLLVIFSGKGLHVKVDSVLGWKTIGKAMTARVKETDSNELVYVTELGGRTPAELYEHYLRVKRDQYFVQNSCEFPFIFEMGGMQIARVPFSFEDDGSMFFFGQIRDYERLRFSYGIKADILQHTATASREMEAFAPQGLFLVICPNRPLCLGKDEHKEIGFYHAVTPNLAYAYGACEFLQYHGVGGVLNSVLLAIGMREGDKPDQNGCGEEPCQQYDRDTERIPLADRFAVFLDAMTSELEEMAKEAKAASEAKSAFLSKMSHEILTPINAVLGLNEMILRESDDANVLAYAASVRTAGNTLLGIINDILDFSKIEAGKMEIIPVEYDLSSVINDLVNMIQTRADDKGLLLKLDFDETMPRLLYGDEVRVKQVITNILTNAVKYTEKGSVTFHMGYEPIPEDPDGILLYVSVQDSGIGIKREDIQKLFHEFERIDEKRNRNIEGTGLGMNITQKLLALMGTTLEVESVYGEGSKFSFRLKQRVVRWDPIGNFEEAYRRMLAERKTAGGRFTAPEADVLVVDDTPMNLLVFKSLLSRTRVRVHMADGGQEALALSRERKFDLIFLDHMMPVMDGIETLHALRGEQDNPNLHTPVVCLTANAISGARERYLAEGFDDYLTKPIDSLKLEELLLHYLPAEKIILSGPDTRREDPKPEVSIPALERLRGASGLDLDAGIQNSGSAEAYLPLLKLFSDSLEEKMEELDRLCREGDIKGYTIKIHAMKSSVRMIGAMELGEEAQLLEQAGGNGDMEFILARHEAYISKLRTLQQRLAEALREEDSRPEAEEEMVEDALEEIRSAAEDRDGERLTDVFAEMNDYRIPGSRAKLWEALSGASENEDFEGIMQLLSEQG